jgi:hypothetical protein
MSNRIHAYGTQLQMSDGAGTPVFTAIAGLTNIEGPGISVESHDSTAHDSANAAREKLPGLFDAGQVSIEGYYDPSSATHDSTTGIVFVARSRLIRAFKIIDVDTGASTTAFNGFFVSFNPTRPFDGLMGFSATLEITGLPTFPL